MIRSLTITFAAAALAALAGSAAAAPCAGNPDALGTARVLQVDAATTPRVGRKQFPATLPLARKELVLTFDDGPWPATTPTVLAALAHECVHATFFMVGEHSRQFPALARRVLADGHTVGHHTYSHRLLDRVPASAAQAQIENGFAADDTALYGKSRSEPVTPFFRFPGFASTPPLLAQFEQRGIVVFGADLWASDWNPMTPEQELDLILQRVEHAGRGIVLFHDTKKTTAKILPAFLRAIKQRGYSIVHIVPGGGRATGHHLF